ncbi:MAG: SUMF1/EgtB/PvdO family nonheme iron enzyme [Janthinobacterium lividum]
MPGFVIAVLLCAGASCDMLPAEPGVSYSTENDCAAALAERGKPLSDAVVAHRHGARAVETVCMQQAQPITEVEDRYYVLETVVVHTGPSAGTGYVGVVEGGQRTLVTGVVNGTNWLRVLLADGNTGFVYGEHLRKIGSRVPAPQAPPPAATPAAANAQVPAASPPAPAAAAPVPIPTAAAAAAPASPIMVPIPGGSFAMGSSFDASERPIRRVVMPAFAIGKFVVTAAEWNACAAAGGCTYKPAQAETDQGRRPMTNLSWDDATQYVQWLRQTTGKPYRLLSEAEWEYAARAGSTTRYSWGDQVGTGQADCEGCGGPHNPRAPADVSAFPANAWGLSGMQGGVAQWVEDCWHSTYQGAPSDGSAWRTPNCPRHVLRGGSWNNPPSSTTVSGRNFYDSGVRYLANGMRVALTIPDGRP